MKRLGEMVRHLGGLKELMHQKIINLMEEFSVTFGDLATRLGISKQTLTRKMKGTTDWTYPEMMMLAQMFHIEDPQEFFFGGN